MAKILLVEDSKSLNEAVEIVLRREDYVVQSAFDGAEGLSYALTDSYDLIIMDVLMPKMNGFDVLRQLRSTNITTPVIMLTALSQEENKIEGLDSGADDYMTKPFSMPELLARVRALIRRNGDVGGNNALKYLGVSLSLSTYELSYNDKSITLSRKECELIKLFYANPTHVMERETLINKVWGEDNASESNNLEVFISFLRKKLAHIEAPFSIAPVRGVGYKLK